MEKIVHPRLYSFLEKNSLLFERQYGFCNKLSTNHALIDITSKIQTASDKGIFACGVHVDFKKAFDTVTHEFLINKLNHYGIRVSELQWFKMYLATTTAHSSKQPLFKKCMYQLWNPSGICPGSFAVPYLHNINDLNKAIKYSDVHVATKTANHPKPTEAKPSETIRNHPPETTHRHQANSKPAPNYTRKLFGR